MTGMDMPQRRGSGRRKKVPLNQDSQVAPSAPEGPQATAQAVSIGALRAWCINKRGVSLDGDEMVDPEEILVSAHVDNAIGPDVDRRLLHDEHHRRRYTLGTRKAAIALIVQMGLGWGVFSPEQSDTEKPQYGEFRSMVEAEAEAVSRIMGKRPAAEQE